MGEISTSAIISHLVYIFITFIFVFQCFNFDKFVAYTDRDEMMADGMAMMENDVFWAVIEFPGMDASTVTMPTKIEYKIRMDTDKVDSTKRTRDK